MGFRVLMAISRDGYLAKNADDDMKWTGATDKALFRILTFASPTLLAGRKTAEMMPPLKGREIISISRDSEKGLSLQQAAAQHPNAWLIGGGSVVKAALDAGLVDYIYLSWVSAPIRSGVPWSDVFKDYIGDECNAPIEGLLIENDVNLQVFKVVSKQKLAA